MNQHGDFGKCSGDSTNNSGDYHVIHQSYAGSISKGMGSSVSERQLSSHAHVALFRITKEWKQPKYLTDEASVVYTHMEYYVVVRKEEILTSDNMGELGRHYAK